MNQELNKKSFFKKLFGESFYEIMQNMGWMVIAPYSFLLALSHFLTTLCYSKYVSIVYSWLTGTSLFFIAYTIIWIGYLDFNFEDKEQYVELQEKKSVRRFIYALLYLWRLFIIILGITAIVISNENRKYYHFQCQSFYVEKAAKCYHIDNQCEFINYSHNIIQLKGYQIEEAGYDFCKGCEDLAIEIDASIDELTYRRK